MRTFHFYEENERVVKQVAALQAGDFDGFLRLVQESGQSSWEYLQNVIPAGYTTHQDMAVAIAVAKQALRGTGAVRVHGGGFAGTIQAFVPLDMLETFRAEVEAVLGAGSCHVLSIRPVGGTCL
jgi:galactokinase